MSSVKPDDHADELDCGQECIGEFVVARSDGAEVFEFVEEPLDEVAFAIQGEVRLSRLDAIGLGRNDRHDPPLLKGVDQGIGVIGFVGQERPGIDLIQQRLGLTDVGRLAGCERQRDGIAQRIDDGMDLGGQSAA